MVITRWRVAKSHVWLKHVWLTTAYTASNFTTAFNFTASKISTAYTASGFTTASSFTASIFRTAFAFVAYITCVAHTSGWQLAGIGRLEGDPSLCCMMQLAFIVLVGHGSASSWFIFQIWIAYICNLGAYPTQLCLLANTRMHAITYTHLAEEHSQ